MKFLWAAFFAVGSAWASGSPQTNGASPYLISARPGSLNYFEGSAFLNNQPIHRQMLGKTFLSTSDVLTTADGRVEILLTPGAFLRIGANSKIRIPSLSLIDIQVDVMQGEAMVEVDSLLKDNRIEVATGGSQSMVRKPGLYRFLAGNPSAVASLEGKLVLTDEGSVAEIGKNHEVVLGRPLQERRINKEEEDDLYAWSNERSEYDSAASYQTAQAAASSYSGSGFDASVGGGPAGWYWNQGFDSWAWLPGYDMAFFSPFGYGFFAPGVVGYAPICYAVTNGNRWNGPFRGTGGRVPLPVNPQRPPATASVPRSPWQAQQATAAATRTFAATGFSTYRGGYVPVGARMTTSAASARLSGHASGSAVRAGFVSGSGGRVGSWARSGGCSRASASGGGGRSGGGGGHFSGGGGGGGHFSGGGGGGGHSGGGGGGGHR